MQICRLVTITITMTVIIVTWLPESFVILCFDIFYLFDGCFQHGLSNLTCEWFYMYKCCIYIKFDLELMCLVRLFCVVALYTQREHGYLSPLCTAFYDLNSTSIVGTDTRMSNLDIHMSSLDIHVSKVILESGKTETAKNSRLCVAFRMFFQNFCGPIG